MNAAGWIAIAVLWLVVVCLAIAVLALARQIGMLHERLPQAGALKSGPAEGRGGGAGRRGQRLLRAPLRVGGADPRADTLSCSSRRAVRSARRCCPRCARSGGASSRACASSWRATVRALEHADFIAAETLERVHLRAVRGARHRLGAGRLPHAVLIDGAGIVRASGLVNSREHLDSLFEARERGVASLQEWCRQARPAMSPSRRAVGEFDD